MRRYPARALTVVKVMIIRSGFCVLFFAIAIHFAAGDNYNVINTSDSGLGSLRQAILDAILSGQRDPVELAQLCHSRVKSPRDKVAQALVGDYRSEHLFTLKQSLEGYRYYQKLILELDQETARLMEALPSATEHPMPPRTKATAYHRQGNDPRFDLRSELYRIAGVDLGRRTRSCADDLLHRGVHTVGKSRRREHGQVLGRGCGLRAQRAAFDAGAIHDSEDREARPHPAREKPLEPHVKAGLLLSLAHRRLFRRLVILDQTAGERPVAITRTVIQPDQEDATVTFHDGVRADLDVHEVGEAAHRTGRPVAAVDAGRDERRAIARAERETRRAVDHPLASRSFR